MKMKSSIYVIFILMVAFFIACDGGTESGGSSGGGDVLLDGSDSGQDPGGSPTEDPTPPGSLNDFQAFMLGVVNQARSQSRNCGGQFFAAAPPVVWDERIEAAALMHSEDMAARQSLSHTGSDGSDAGDRLLIEDYNWFTWGENILFGLTDGQEVVDALLDSASHCELIMGQGFLEMGVGTVSGTLNGDSSEYWTIVLATENN